MSLFPFHLCVCSLVLHSCSPSRQALTQALHHARVCLTTNRNKEGLLDSLQCHTSVDPLFGLVGLSLLCRFRAVLACLSLCLFYFCPSLRLLLCPPALLSPTTKKGENRRPVKRRSGLSTGRPVCRGLKVDDIRSVSGRSGLSSGRPVCKWTTSALSINIQNAEHPVCKWTPKTSGL